MKLEPHEMDEVRDSLLQLAAERQAALDPKKRFGKYIIAEAGHVAIVVRFR